MITIKSWGYEDKVCDNGRLLVMNEYGRTSSHRHSIDECILVDSGLVYVEVAESAELLDSEGYHKTSAYLQDNARMTIRAGLFHRLTSLRDSLVWDFSAREDRDVERIKAGGRISEESYRSLLSLYIKQQNQDRIITSSNAATIAACLRSYGHSIGFCNGCFDLIHLGHIELLRQAKMRCDFLFVGVNNDTSVRAMKGENRPYIDEIGRMGMVESIRFVDYVVEIVTPNCVDVVKQIKPDIYTTTSEYGTSGLESQAVIAQGGRIEIIDMIKGFNTTKTAMNITASRR